MRPIALMDGNNFFASCEIAFNPALKGRSLVCLSSNDAAVIARSPEAKALGIKMAQPYFQVRHFERSHGLIAQSANFALYTDMSERIYQCVAPEVSDILRYSIDENFLSLEGLEHLELDTVATQLRTKVLQWTGIPTGLGIGSSFTLAKAASALSKKYPATGGVVNLYSDINKRDRALATLPVASVWGVGRAYASKLNKVGVNSALDLARMNNERLRNEFGVILARTARELRGEEVLPWEVETATNQQIIASRSMGHPVKDFETLMASVSHHVARGAKKLRAQNSVAASISVYIHTNAYHQKTPYMPHLKQSLVRPTADQRLLNAAAGSVLKKIFRPGLAYIKTGIVLGDIRLAGHSQGDLFTQDITIDTRAEQLMNTLDRINARYGGHVLSLGNQCSGGDWQPKAARRSPNYIGDWASIPLVRA